MTPEDSMDGYEQYMDDQNNRAGFHRALRHAVTVHGFDAKTDTPDYELANYLLACMDAYWNASRHRIQEPQILEVE